MIIYRLWNLGTSGYYYIVKMDYHMTGWFENKTLDFDLAI